MPEPPRNTDGLGCWGDAGMGLGIYIADEAEWLVPGLWHEARYVPHREVAAYVADGWEVSALDCHHGAYSALAVREVAA